MNWLERISNFNSENADFKNIIGDFHGKDSQSFMSFIDHFQKTDGMWNNVINMDQFKNFLESIDDAGKRYEIESFRWDAHVHIIANIRRIEELQQIEENVDLDDMLSDI